MKKQNKYKIHLLVGLAVLVLIFALGYLYTYSKNLSLNKSQGSTTRADEKFAQEQPKDTNSSSEANAKQTEDSTKKVFLSNITADTQRVYFGNSLTGISTGECKLSISQNGINKKEVKGKVELITSYYSCSGMVVAKSDLPIGILQAVITVTTSDQNVASDEVKYENK